MVFLPGARNVYSLRLPVRRRLGNRLPEREGADAWRNEQDQTKEKGAQAIPHCANLSRSMKNRPVATEFFQTPMKIVEIIPGQKQL